ncbi:MAG: hypothetical protein ACN6NI_01275 [Acinetobacter sp.]
MNKLLLSVLLLTASFTLTNANTGTKISLNSGELKGRYAIDCSTQKAHDLSYVMGDKSILRLISARQKHGLLKSIEQKPAKPFEDYKYLSTAKYQGFTVDFYQKDDQNWARVKNTSITNFFGPKTSQLLMQCRNESQS